MRIIHEAHPIRMRLVTPITLEKIQVAVVLAILVVHQVHRVIIQEVATQVILVVVHQVHRDLIRAVAQVIHAVHRVIIQAVAQVILVVRQVIVQEVVVQAILVARQAQARVREVAAVAQEVDKSSCNRIKKEQVKTCSFLLVIDFV